jgi:hypothetical protein
MPIFNRYRPQPEAPADAGTPSAPGMPPGVAQIVQSVNAFMPAIEQITGLTRRDIFLSLLKGGMKGQGFESILNTLMGHQEKEVKFVRYVKTLAIWVPVAVLLFGLAMVSIIVFAKFLIVILGVF